jgi:hypothetical protein
MKQQTRRDFLGNAFSGVALAGASVASLRPLLSFAGQLQQPPAAAPDKRTYVAGKYGLELSGRFTGWVNSVEGGHTTAEVVAESTGFRGVETKHIAGVKYEDVVVTCGTGMSANWYDWIKASLAGQTAVKDGAIVNCDFNFNEVSRLAWFNAAITEVGFPACDAGSKDAAKMTIKFAPEMTRFVAKQGGRFGPNVKLVKEGRWSPANFRLQIDGLDCSRVNKIEAISAKTLYSATQSKALLGQASGRAQPRISNLIVILPQASSESFYRWHQSFVVEGRGGPQGEKGGRLAYLTPNLEAALFGLTFQHLGILKLTPFVTGAGIAAIQHVQVEMYCGGLGFDWSAAAWA